MIIPMNAKSAGSKLEKLMDDPRYIAEIKLDGYRAICENGVFTSRLGNDLSAKVPHLTQILKEYNVTLDGELCLGGTTNSSDVTKILGSLPEKAIARQEELGKLRYVVFDVLAMDGISIIDKPWSVRRQMLRLFFDSIERDEHLEFPGTHINKRRLLEYAESNGLEGIMLKNVDALYYPDKRPENTWYKVKKHMTCEVVVMDFTEGKGKFKGYIGAIVFGMYQGDTLIECGQCSGMTDEVRREISVSPEYYKGKVMEINAMEGTSHGYFRHPVFKGFRDDKEANDCRWDQ